MEFADCGEPFCDEPSAVRYHDYVGHTLLTGSSGSLNQGLKNHPFQTDDAALLPIAKKVLGGERLHTSAVKCEHLITIEQSLVQRKIGSLSTALMGKINDCLKASLDLP